LGECFGFCMCVGVSCRMGVGADLLSRGGGCSTCTSGAIDTGSRSGSLRVGTNLRVRVGRNGREARVGESEVGTGISGTVSRSGSRTIRIGSGRGVPGVDRSAGTAG
jgi:hypothetical protein